MGRTSPGGHGAHPSPHGQCTLLSFFYCLLDSSSVWYPTVTECFQAVPAFVLPATSPPSKPLFSLMPFSTQHNTHMHTSSGVILQATQDCFDAQISSDRCWDFSPSPLHLRSSTLPACFLSRCLTNGILMWDTYPFLIVLKLGSSEGAAVCSGCNLCPCLPLPMWNLTLLVFNHRKPD